MKPLLVVSTLLGGEGPTGVETHFSQIIHKANEEGIETALVTPYTINRLARVPFRPLKNLRGERAQVAYRCSQAFLLKVQLRSILRKHAGRPVTFYAQCPLSAKAALAARGSHSVRVVLVVHYNVAQSSEAIEHGNGRGGGPLCRHLDAVERYVLPRVDGIAFVSDFMRRVVNARVPAASSVAQETIFNFPPTLGLPAETDLAQRDLIAIGTLEPRKNQQFLLSVLAAANQLGCRYTLSIVGDGPDRAMLERLSRSLGLDAQVKFMGFQRNASRLIASHRMLVHAAKVENCPLIVTEACASGRPVAAAPVGGIPELYSDGVEGIFWDLLQPQAAARQIAALLGDPARYNAASASARRRYERVFAHSPGRWLSFLVPGRISPEMDSLNLAKAGGLRAEARA